MHVLRTHLLKLLLSVVCIVLPIKGSILTVLTLVAVDLISGVWAARARKEPIESNKLKRTAAKLCVYLTAVILAYFTELYLTGDLIQLSKIIGGFIGITEMKSILENAESITGMPLFKLLIDKLTTERNS